MSVSIGWRPNNPNKLNYINGGSSFHTVMDRCFGSFPITLTMDDYKTLEGIEACGHDGATDLMCALNEQGSIIVDAEW